MQLYMCVYIYVMEWEKVWHMSNKNRIKKTWENGGEVTYMLVKNTPKPMKDMDSQILKLVTTKMMIIRKEDQNMNGLNIQHKV